VSPEISFRLVETPSLYAWPATEKPVQVQWALPTANAWLGLSVKATGAGEAGSIVHVAVPEVIVAAERLTASRTPEKRSEPNRVFMSSSSVSAPILVPRLRPL